MKLACYVDTRGLEEIRQKCLDEKHGAVGAFKAALGIAALYWRKMFAPEHFTVNPNSRYPGVAYKAKYSFTTGRSSGGETIKERTQKRRGFTPDLSQITFSGLTRQGILQGPVRLSGTSQKVTMHFQSGTINWQALSRHIRGSEYSLGKSIVYVNDQEHAELTKHIQNEWFPMLLDAVNRGAKVSDLNSLPLMQ